MDNELLNYKISEDKDYAGNVAVTTTGRVERLVLTCYLQGKYCIVTEYNGEYSIVMKERLCQNADTAFFYAQSPDFLKPGLCYYPKFSYL